MEKSASDILHSVFVIFRGAYHTGGIKVWHPFPLAARSLCGLTSGPQITTAVPLAVTISIELP